MIDTTLPVSLIEYYIYSNTPWFLFYKFRSNSFIMSLVEQNSTDDLIKEFNRECNNESSKIEHVVWLYAVLISVSLKNEEFTLEKINNLNTNCLKWGDQIKKIIIEQYKPLYFYSNYFTSTKIPDPIYKIAETSTTEENVFVITKE